jgi:ribosomal protein S12 methylthiotransferase accessory factor
MEVFERDAITRDIHKSQANNRILPMDLINWRSIDHPVIRPLFEQIHAADIIPLLFCCTTDTGIPTYNCFIADRLNPNEGFFHGMGAGMDEATAILRATTEAVQARSALRAGTRDIFFHADARFHSLSNPMSAIEQCGGEAGGRDLKSFVDLSTDSFQADVNRCIQQLAKVGLDQIIVIRLTPDDLDFVVARVIVPGLEGYMLPLYSPGKRALDMLEEATQ